MTETQEDNPNDTVEYGIFAEFKQYLHVLKYFPMLKMLAINSNEWREIELPVSEEDKFVQFCKERNIEIELIG